MKTESREYNKVAVTISVESDCDPKQGEYSMVISGLIGGLDINQFGGVDDISLIKECIENDFDLDNLPSEGFSILQLEETGEREDVFWNKYYEIRSVFTYQM